MAVPQLIRHQLAQGARLEVDMAGVSRAVYGGTFPDPSGVTYTEDVPYYSGESVRLAEPSTRLVLWDRPPAPSSKRQNQLAKHYARESARQQGRRAKPSYRQRQASARAAKAKREAKRGVTAITVRRNYFAEGTQTLNSAAP